MCFFLPLVSHGYAIETPAQIEDYIIYKAEHEQIPVSLALAIAKAESGLIWNAHNPIGTASGVFQFLDSTFQTYCVKKYAIAESLLEKDNPIKQVNCAIEIMAQEKDGWSQWLESRCYWIKGVVDPMPYLAIR